MKFLGIDEFNRMELARKRPILASCHLSAIVPGTCTTMKCELKSQMDTENCLESLVWFEQAEKNLSFEE